MIPLEGHLAVAENGFPNAPGCPLKSGTKSNVRLLFGGTRPEFADPV